MSEPTKARMAASDNNYTSSQNEKNLLLLGGYGTTGRLVAELMLQQTENVQLTLAGRTLPKATAVAKEFNERFHGDRVRAVYADASDKASILHALKHPICGDTFHMIVVLSSTGEHTKQVAEAALEAGVDYFDINFTTEKTVALQELEPMMRKLGKLFITEGGFHPGLPAAMIRYVASNKLEQVETALVGSVMQEDWKRLNLSESTMEEFAGEFLNYKALVYKDGKWMDVGFVWSTKVINYGKPIGLKYGIPWYIDELHHLPELIPSLKETGFYISGLHWFLDFVLTPIIMLGLWLFPNRGRRLMGKWLFWGMATFTKKPYIAILQLEASGTKKDKDGGTRPVKSVFRVSHDDCYALTAIPAVACLLQYLDGTLAGKSGLDYQALVVEPKRFINDIEKLGAAVMYEETSL